MFIRSTEKLFYGTGTPAPWNNSHLKPPPASTNIIGKKAKEALTNGKAAEPKPVAVNEKAEVVDATLYATWDWDRKDFRIPLPPGKRSRQSFSIPGAGTRSGTGISIVTGSTGGHSSRAKGAGKVDANKG